MISLTVGLLCHDLSLRSLSVSLCLSPRAPRVDRSGTINLVKSGPWSLYSPLWTVIGVGLGSGLR